MPLRLLSLACLLVACLLEVAIAEPLLRVRQPSTEADFLEAADSGAIKFRVGGQDLHVPDEQLIRWSNFEPNSSKAELVLHDGSRIVLADSWTGEPSWQLKSDLVTASTELFGKVSFPRTDVRAILVRVPKGLVPRTRFMDHNIRKPTQMSALNLINGDRWEGKTISIVQPQNQQQFVQLFRNAGEAPIQFPLQQIAAITFKSPGTLRKTNPQFVVGTRGGSLLHVESISADESHLRLQLACGVPLTGTDRRDVKYLAAQAAALEYLSDRESIDDRHVPYLEIPWQFQRDRNVLSQPLRSQGKVFAKGLGVHTASRLSFDLKAQDVEEKFQRFVASVAVDDAAGKRGSVIFRVYLRQDNQWQQAFESPIVRGGDLPLPVAVELGEATHLALLTDYADRGDELDYANWLEARLE